MLKVSCFTVTKGLADRGLPDRLLVFNTLSGKCLLLDHEAWETITRSLNVGQPSDPEISDAIGRLCHAGILVGAEVDEHAQYQDSFDRQRNRPPHLFPILAVTTGCNIACTYCYEEGVKSRTMTADVVAGVIRWIESRIQEGYRSINPSLFGGEPLLVPQVLFSLMDGINALQQKYPGFRNSFSGSSNGILLTPDLGRSLGARGLRYLQISLDGPQRIHDERRIGHRKQPSFDEAYRGIRIAAQCIENVTIKVNFDRHNRNSIRELFQFLAAEGLSNKVDVKLEAIAGQINGGAHDLGFVIPPERSEMAEAYLQMMVEAREQGIRVSYDTTHTTPCMFSSHHGVIIGPDGSIYKCISLVGRDEFKVGSVFDDDYDREEYRAQMNGTKRIEQCIEENCPYIPVCAGGCAYEAIVRTGTYKVRFCTKEYLDAYHYKRYLFRHERHLTELGASPLTADELRGLPAPVPIGSSTESSSRSIAGRLLRVIPS
jgi:uncharacterized protein